MTVVSLTATAHAVADRTARLPVTIWGYGIGGTLSGLVRATSVLDDPAYAGRVEWLVGPALAAAPAPTDHLIPVEALLALRKALPSAAIDAACSRWVAAVLGAPEAWPGGPRVHRPDLEPWSTTLWVDCMHTDGPGLAALGRPAESVEYATAYAAVLQRDDGLFHHGYDVAARRGNGVAWGRGQAWALFGLVDTLVAVGDRYRDGGGLRERLDRLMAALAAHEDGGRWHTVVDDPGSPVEDSVAAYLAWGLRRAVRYGLADASYAAVADRAFAATVAALEDGALVVSEATPVGGLQNYVSRATGVFPWGQAPVLHAVLDRIEEEQHP